MSSHPAGHDANPLLLWRLLKEMERWSPHIVHTHLIHADLYGQIAARARGVTGVSSVHGTHPFYRREPGRSAARLAGHLASRTIAISRYAGDFVCEVGIAPPDRVRVIHYGIDPSSWLGSKEDRAERRRALCLDPDDIAVGVASRLVPEKGHDVAVRAFAAVAERLPRTRLLIAGDGPLRAEVEEMARRHLPSRQVSMLGFVEDIRGFFGACDLVLFPSLPSFGEGFGLAALEAMAAGVPVVASDAGPLPEVVSDGESGLVVAAGDDQAWAQAIFALASDRSLRLHLGNGARARACRDFSVEDMADRTVAVYREVVSEGPPVIASRVRARIASRSVAGDHAAKRWSSLPASRPVRRVVRQQLRGGPAKPGVDRASGSAETCGCSNMPGLEVGATDPTVS